MQPKKHLIPLLTLAAVILALPTNPERSGELNTLTVYDGRAMET
jgi:hypothetical protein